MVAGGKKNRHNHNGGGNRSRSHHVDNTTNNPPPPPSSADREYDHHSDVDGDNGADQFVDPSLDFCQRFFGDVLYTNFNVMALFLIATLLPVLCWIPHFLIEYGAMGGGRGRRDGMGTGTTTSSSQSSSSSYKGNAALHDEPAMSERRGRRRGTIHPHDVLAELGLRSTTRTTTGVPSSFRDYFDVVIGEEGDYYYPHATIQPNPDYRGRSTMTEESTTSPSSSSSSSSTSSDEDSGGRGGSGGGERSSKRGGKNEGRGRMNDPPPVPSHLLRRDRVSSIPPVLCPDGVTRGYDNWIDLRNALSAANDNAAEDFLLWNEYLVAIGYEHDGDGEGVGGLEFEGGASYTPPEPFVICPGMTLNYWGTSRGGGGWLSPRAWATYLTSFLLPSSSSPSSSRRRRRQRRRRRFQGGKGGGGIGMGGRDAGPIFVNAEDLIIECDMCAIDMTGTHLSFGPYARNVLIRGITFRGATTSSLTFHHHGADVRFEDCYWLYNSGGIVRNGQQQQQLGGYDDVYGGASGSTTTAGAVADINSTSSVSFHRCVMDDVKQNPKRTTTGAGIANVPGMNPPAGHHGGMMMNQYGNGGSGGGVGSSSLTIRN